MARLKAEKEQQKTYKEYRLGIMDAFDKAGVPDLYTRASLVGMAQAYMITHGVELEEAVERISAVLKDHRRTIHADLYPSQAHQHVWQKLSVNGWACRSCPALGQWDGNDSSPMEVTK